MPNLMRQPHSQHGRDRNGAHGWAHRVPTGAATGGTVVVNTTGPRRCIRPERLRDGHAIASHEH
ncbi:hypothetical protein PJP10_11600 [Mycobacterium kansasii]